MKSARRQDYIQNQPSSYFTYSTKTVQELIENNSLDYNKILFDSKNMVTSPDLEEVKTSSPQNVASNLYSSNIRGYFLREQMNSEEILRQNEFKRKTKEYLDQQLEEKRLRENQYLRSQPSTQPQLSIIAKQQSVENKDFPKNVSRKTSLSEIPMPMESRISGRQGLHLRKETQEQKRKIQTKDPENIDLRAIQEIIFENQQLKQNLEYKQQIIDLLVKPKIQRENVRQKALQEIKESEKIQYSLGRRQPYYSPNAKIVVPKFIKRENTQQSYPETHKMMEKKSHPDIFRMIEEDPNLQQIVPEIAMIKQNFSNLNQKIHRKLHQGAVLKSVDLQMQTSVNNSQENENSKEHVNQQQINNFTFANNLVEKLRTTQQSSKASNFNSKIKIMKEFYTNALNKKFCC